MNEVFVPFFLVQLAQEYAPVAYSVAASIGIIQGMIMGRAIVDRFPRLQFYARLALISLSVLFISYAVISAERFADPEKVNPSELINSTPEQFAAKLMQIIGISANMGAIIAFSVIVFVFIILKLTGLRGYRGYFMLAMGLLMLILMIIVKFSDYRPTSFEILLFILYEAGMIGGLLWATSKRLHSKELKMRNFVNWWQGS